MFEGSFSRGICEAHVGIAIRRRTRSLHATWSRRDFTMRKRGSRRCSVILLELEDELQIRMHANQILIFGLTTTTLFRLGFDFRLSVSLSLRFRIGFRRRIVSRTSSHWSRVLRAVSGRVRPGSCMEEGTILALGACPVAKESAFRRVPIVALSSTRTVSC